MKEVPKPAPPLTPDQKAKVEQLIEEDIKKIDEAILLSTWQHWRKVASVVGKTMVLIEDQFPGIPDSFYAERVRKLVEVGLLISQGNLEYMRFSEVRLPPQEMNGKET